MIIINQDKNMIVFSKNIVNLYAAKIKNEKGKVETWIICNDVNNNTLKLGKYTAKRIGEILQQIIDTLLRYATVQDKEGEISQITTIPVAYQMPEK